MKNLLFILFLTFNCSAQKAEYDVINDFLASELKNVKYDTIYLQTEPLDNVEMLWLYEQAYKERSPARKDPESVWLSQKANEWPLDEKGIIYLRKRIKANENNWEAEDFNNKSFVFKEKMLLMI